MKWYRGFALQLRLLRHSVLLPPNVQPTPLLGKILDPTLPAYNRNRNQANNRNGECKSGNVGLHDCRPSDAFGLGMNRSHASRCAPRARAWPPRTLCPLRRKARRDRVQSATLSSAALAASPSAGGGEEAAGVMSELDVAA